MPICKRYLSSLEVLNILLLLLGVLVSIDDWIVSKGKEEEEGNREGREREEGEVKGRGRGKTGGRGGRRRKRRRRRWRR